MPPKKIPKKPRVVTQKQKQRQSVNVTINQERPIRRRGPNKPKPSGGGGGGGGQGPSQGPSPIQFTPYQMSNPAPQPQPVINILNEIPDNFNENVRYYRNPFRLQPFRENMDQNNLRPVEGPLGQPLPPAPQPVLPDIVEEPIVVVQASSTPVVAIPISSSNPIQGFVEQFPRNELSQEQLDRLYQEQMNRFKPMYVPLNPRSPLSEFQQSMGDIQSNLRQSLSLEQPEPQSPPMQQKSKGRPFTVLSQEDKESINLYLDYKDRPDKRDVSNLERYKRGRKIITQNKSNNPEVMQFIADRGKKA